jgi:hypothetical protein
VCLRRAVATACTPSVMSLLTDFESSVLTFERVVRTDVNAKAEAVRKTLGVSPARYFQFLDSIIRKKAAFSSICSLFGACVGRGRRPAGQSWDGRRSDRDTSEPGGQGRGKGCGTSVIERGPGAFPA